MLKIRWKTVDTMRKFAAILPCKDDRHSTRRFLVILQYQGLFGYTVRTA